ncbi:bifunctional DNA primase/polymerase [Sphingomonas citri]
MTSPAELPDAWRTPVELGFSVFPVVYREKRPALPSWKAYQTARPPLEKIAEWARAGSNIGIATGAVSGLLVLDLDNADAIASAEARGLPETLAVRTGKGRHVYLAHPGGKVGNRAGIFPGADIRGDGGYVVGPGSIHPNGSAYEWENPPGLFDLAPPPAWLADMLRKPALIASEAEKVRRAPAGSRNDQLNKSAFRLGQEGADSTEARRALMVAAATAGLEAEETGKTLTSG